MRFWIADFGFWIEDQAIIHQTHEKWRCDFVLRGCLILPQSKIENPKSKMGLAE
jgi:hypothetical protein